MGALRKASAGILGLTLLFQAPPLCAATDALPLFATCTGRFSALIEHQWLTGEASDSTAADRAAMLALLEAVTGADQRTEAMALRVEAKLAEAALLEQASFGPVANRLWARARAQTLVEECRSMLLTDAGA